MKKNIGFINLDFSLLDWLCEELRTSPSEITGAEEFLEVLKDLQRGKCDSVILEVNEEDVPSLNDRVITCGILSIYPKARKVLREGKEVFLTPKEFDLLYFLALNRGEVFTKEQIYQAVWEGDYLLDSSNIMAFIRKLRKKIEPNPDAPKYIQTIWGIGYKFNDKE